MKRFSKAEKERAIELYKQGLPRAEIARQIGCSVPTVGLWVNAAGIEKRRPRISKAIREKILELYEIKCLSCSEIAKRLSINESTVYYMIDRLGKMRSISHGRLLREQHGKRGNLRRQVINVVVILRLKRFRMKDIQKITNFSNATICSLLRSRRARNWMKHHGPKWVGCKMAPPFESWKSFLKQDEIEICEMLQQLNGNGPKIQQLEVVLDAKRSAEAAQGRLHHHSPRLSAAGH